MFDPIADRLLFIVGIADHRRRCGPTVGLLVGGHPRSRSRRTVAIATIFFGMKRFDVTWLGKIATFL